MENKLRINNKGTSKSTIILGIVAVIVVAAFGIFSVYAIKGNDGTGSATTNLNNGNIAEGEYQSATLKFINYEYILEPKTLKKDIPVRITVDTNTVRGCMRDIVIAEFGVRKYVSPTDNIIEFTPDKEGTFWIVCSMNMGQGTFSVLANADKVSQLAPLITTQSSNTENTSPPPAPAGTCGMAAGGSTCGCGRR